MTKFDLQRIMGGLPKHHSLTVGNRTVATHYAEYAGGRLAIKYVDIKSGEPFSILTVNLPDDELADGEFFVKTWSENEKTAKAAIESGFYKDTGRRVKTGFVEAEVWKFAIQ